VKRLKETHVAKEKQMIHPKNMPTKERIIDGQLSKERKTKVQPNDSFDYAKI
jgi:hypothetical protein